MSALRQTVNESLKRYDPFQIVLISAGTVVAAYTIGKIASNVSEFKEAAVRAAFDLATKLPGVKGQVEKGKNDVRELLGKSLVIPNDQKFFSLPLNGLSHEEVLAKMQQWHDHDAAHYDRGMVSGCIYMADKHHDSLNTAAYSMFSLTNPLHPNVFPTVRKFETEVIQMTLRMLGGDPDTACGTTTSGGTESLLMAIKTYRDEAFAKGKTRYPEIIVPVTAHAAFDKGGQYFGVKVVHVPLGDDYAVDMKAMRRAINRNTILLVGSAPNFPHGIVDPISEIAALAKEHGIGCHVDCCLGGFVLPFFKALGHPIPAFDFSVEGVTSISADTHKYGYAAKGTSILCFKTRALRDYMYFVCSEWPGGVYASPTMPGSRPGGLIASAWASMVSMGMDGYMTKANLILKTVKIMKEGIQSIPELFLIGDSKTMVLAFDAHPPHNIYRVYDAMSKKGWHLNALQKPAGIHICVTARHADEDAATAHRFVTDLREAVDYIKSNTAETDGEGGMAPVYGTMAKLPNVVIRDVATAFIDVLLDEKEKPQA
eukprot:TRINITY_DN861_c0_g1_i3.p1 TRINITY_DN861_c0_g1~~TRINITY_DN861_c0_g1_i3.p1  ORF type:complete len:554 (+),score=149.44 TRINITY_DN861_c0_g1_i3:40-1662(+)